MPDQDITGATDLESTSGDFIPIRQPETPTGHVIITMTPELSLEMKDKDPQALHKFVETFDGETFLAVREDSVIQISLDPKFDWQFDKAKGLLLFKQAADRKFYRIAFRPNQVPLLDLVLHAKATGKPQEDPQSHPFDLFLTIKQMVAGMKGRPLPLTIDPIVKNPPPGGTTQPGAAVPVLSAIA